ncbi:AraC family transcriptional regulator [Hyphococcus flavus]|uniref:AraC family transcriptional regulator n=1 Tax=Hyphococcus flavus TaxID=1866326 RepID=A0AAE9ZG89_9PROT|nr:AraC family transcriptional regulator [Hyphococcus flavus]WDI30291.1 AraC family transcriptional regulator [Hyphococcus flavus]
MSYKVTCRRMETLDNLELQLLQFREQRFPSHFHEWPIIAVLENGAITGEFGQYTYHGDSDCVFFSNAFELNCGESIGDVCYRTFIIPPSIIAWADKNQKNELFYFRETSIRDGSLAESLRLLHEKAFSSDQAAEELELLIKKLVMENGCWRTEANSNEKISAAARDLSQCLEGQASICQLAMDYGYSRNHFTRKFMSAYGVTPSHYFLNRRIEKSRREIGPTTSIAETAAKFGFSDQSHFGRHFKKFFGYSPGAYRASLV